MGGGRGRLRSDPGDSLRCVRIGAEDSRDAYGEWRRKSEVAEDGCLLVRPDGHIAWRTSSAPDADSAAYGELLEALRTVLHR